MYRNSHSCIYAGKQLILIFICKFSIFILQELQNNVHSVKLKNKAIHDFVLASIFKRVPSLKSLELQNVQLIPSNVILDYNLTYPREMLALVFINSDFEVNILVIYEL